LDTIEVIETESQVVLNALTEHDFQDAFKKWQKDWERCIRTKEDYLEGHGGQYTPGRNTNPEIMDVPFFLTTGKFVDICVNTNLRVTSPEVLLVGANTWWPAECKVTEALRNTYYLL
jgi:hypothetical protein